MKITKFNIASFYNSNGLFDDVTFECDDVYFVIFFKSFKEHEGWSCYITNRNTGQEYKFYELIDSDAAYEKFVQWYELNANK